MVYEKSGNSYSAYEELDYIENPEEAHEEATSVYDPNSFDLEEHEQDGTIEIHRCSPDDAYIPKQVVYDNSHNNDAFPESSVSKKDSTINNVAKNSAPEQIDALSQLNESLESRISGLRRNESAVEEYITSHYGCPYLKAIKALGIPDPDDPTNYGLRQNEDGSYSLLEEEPKKLTCQKKLAHEAMEQLLNRNDNDNEPEYIDRNGNLLSWNQINNDADSRGLPVASYMKIYGIVLIEIEKNQKNETNSLDLFLENITLNESYFLRDIISIANLLKDPAFSYCVSDFEKISLKLIRSRANREKLRLTPEDEQNFVRSFKNVLIGHQENIAFYSNRINSINLLS
jgi:hypothetical protein